MKDILESIICAEDTLESQTETPENTDNLQNTYNIIENNILNRKIKYSDVIFNEFKTPFKLIKTEYDETGKKKYKDGLKKEYTKKHLKNV